MTVRVDYTSIYRSNGMNPVDGSGSIITASAVKDGQCPWCEADVMEFEPVQLTGRMLAWNEDETERVVDLSNAEWICQRCAQPHLEED